MAVYVDDMRAPYGRMVMCHMIADTTEELIDMARAIGVNPKWIQKAGTPREHFDICLAMRAKAVARGAIEITWRRTVEMTRYRAEHGRLPMYWAICNLKIALGRKPPY